VRLSLIVPAYNEAKILPSSLERLHRAFPHAELILVADGCVDDTRDVCVSLPFPVRYLQHQPNRGKGFAVKRGMLAARGDLLVFTDADLPFGIEGVTAVLQRLDGDDAPDIVIASKASEQRGPAYQVARFLVRRVVRAVLGLRFEDTQAGLKGFRREPAGTIFNQTVIERFATDMEILYIARKHGYRVRPVILNLDTTHVRPSHFTTKQGLMLLRDIWRIRRMQYR
jgi:dolichyl-phosphate beta-glucosyltransferase